MINLKEGPGIILRKAACSGATSAAAKTMIIVTIKIWFN